MLAANDPAPVAPRLAGRDPRRRRSGISIAALARPCSHRRLRPILTNHVDPKRADVCTALPAAALGIAHRNGRTARARMDLARDAPNDYQIAHY